MKTILIAFLLVLSKGHAQLNGNFILRDSSEIIEQKKRETTCKQRGHHYEQIHVEQFNVFGAGFMDYTQRYFYTRTLDTCYNVLVDDADSSYVVRRPPPVLKYCYRCRTSIEFPVKETFIKTVWRKDKD